MSLPVEDLLPFPTLSQTESALPHAPDTETKSSQAAFTKMEAAVEHALRVHCELQLRLTQADLQNRTQQYEALQRQLEATLEAHAFEHQKEVSERENLRTTLAQECDHLREETQLRQQEIHNLQQEIQTLQKEYVQLQTGAAAAVARRLRTLRTKAAPPGTQRDRVARWTIKGLRSLVAHGVWPTARKTANCLRRKLGWTSSAREQSIPHESPSATSTSTPSDQTAIVAAPAESAATPIVAQTTAVPAKPRTPPPDATHAEWIEENEPHPEDLQRQHVESLAMPFRPLISVLTPIYNTPPEILRATIESLQTQTYDRWELVLADGGSTRSGTRETLLHYGTTDPRVRVIFLEENGGISHNTNACLEAARGDFVALLDHDDTLAPFALFEVVQALNEDRQLDFLYSDKDMLSEDGEHRFGPLFKPVWSPDLMLSANYLTHLCVIRTSLAREIGGFRKVTDGAQDWDFFLRIVERTDRIRHIPKVLYHWRLWSSSVSSGIGAKPYALTAQLRSLEEHFQRTGTRARLEMDDDTMLHLRRTPDSRKTVSIIIATHGDQGTAPRWIEWLESRTSQATPTQDEIEILFAHYGALTQPVEDFYVKLTNRPGVRTVVVPGASRIEQLNRAAQLAHGEILLFLQDGLFPETDATWDDLLVWFDRPGVGIVAGKALFEDDTIALGVLAVSAERGCEVQFAGWKNYSYAYNGHSQWYRNASAASACCLAIRATAFHECQGFDDAFDLAGGEVGLCSRLLERGERIVYTPDATFRAAQQLALPINGTSQDLLKLRERMSANSDRHDPFLSPNLVLQNGFPQIATRGVRAQMVSASCDSRSAGERLFDQRSAVGVIFDPSTAITYALASCHDVEPEQLDASQRLVQAFPGKIRVRSVNWFIPSFHNASYGGIHTILRLAHHLQMRYEVENRFCIVGDLSEQTARQAIAKPFPGLAQQPILPAKTDEETLRLPFADACVATFWTTAYSLVKFNRTKRKFYMIQDCEPMFYSAGSTSGQVEATYRFGFHGLCNTESLRRIYEGDYGGIATHLVPAIDPAIFSPRDFSNFEARHRPFRVFFYGRPNNPRNAFELGVTAFRQLKNRFGNAIEFYSAGEVWDPADFGLSGIVNNLGVLTVEQTAALYRECDLGVVMMFTRHPSYLPFEFMACGCPVLTNVNHATGWFLRDGLNCLLTEATASCLARRIEEALGNTPLRLQIARFAADDIARNHSNWRGELDHLYEFMCDTSNRRPLVKPVGWTKREAA